MTLHDFIAYYLMGSALSAGVILAMLLMWAMPSGLFRWVLTLLMAAALSFAWPVIVPLLFFVVLKGRPLPKYDDEV